MKSYRVLRGEVAAETTAAAGEGVGDAPRRVGQNANHHGLAPAATQQDQWGCSPFSRANVFCIS